MLESASPSTEFGPGLISTSLLRIIRTNNHNKRTVTNMDIKQ